MLSRLRRWAILRVARSRRLRPAVKPLLVLYTRGRRKMTELENDPQLQERMLREIAEEATHPPPEEMRRQLKLAARRKADDPLEIFLTFRRRDPGVLIPEAERAVNDARLDISLQRQFWDLKVKRDRLEVVLPWNGRREPFIIPYAAIVSFIAGPPLPRASDAEIRDALIAKIAAMADGGSGERLFVIFDTRAEGVIAPAALVDVEEEEAVLALEEDCRDLLVTANGFEAQLRLAGRWSAVAIPFAAILEFWATETPPAPTVGEMRQALVWAAGAGEGDRPALSITLRRHDPGVKLPPALAESPETFVTLVLQHRFRRLEVLASRFDVTLSFGGAWRRVSVPFSAVTAFLDNSGRAVDEPPATSASVAGEPEDLQRAARVFISSTFDDMQVERDILVRRIFPAIRARYRELGIEIQDIDLRWGITQEQADRGEILPICLREVERCRPFFLGILGQRYGTSVRAEQLDDSLRAAFPVLEAGDTRSLTELEILHGPLASPAAADRTVFLVRTAADAAGDERLEALKTRVRASPALILDYDDSDQFEAQARQGLEAMLNRAFASDNGPDLSGRADRLHRAYSRERRQLYVGASARLAQMERWLAEAQERPLLVTADSGLGKSALIANWCAARREAGDLVFEHYLGASPDSADPVLLARRLWAYADRMTGVTVAEPAGEAGLFDGLPGRTETLSALADRRGRRFILAVDGIDKLSRRRDLAWLPTRPQAGFSLVATQASRLDPPAAPSGFLTATLEPLSPGDRRQLVEDSLAWMGKALAQDHTALVLDNALSASPLFIRTVLSELKVAASHQALNERLQFYVGVETLAALFARLLDRLERENGPLVEMATTAILASRAGLEEAEILALTGATPAAWSALSLGLGDSLWNQDGRILFAHDYLREAVAARYLAGADGTRAAHLALAEHFDHRSPGRRQAEELPFQRLAAEDWSGLEAALTDLALLPFLRERGDPELIDLWRPLKARNSNPTTALTAALNLSLGEADQWTAAGVDLAAEVRDFLLADGERGEALQTLAQRIEHAAGRLFGVGDPRAVQHRQALGEVLHRRGQTHQALEVMAGVAKARRHGDAPMPELQDGLLSVSHMVRPDIADTLGLAEAVYEERLREFGPDAMETLEAKQDYAASLLGGATTMSRRLIGIPKLRKATAMLRELSARRSVMQGLDHPDTLQARHLLGRALQASLQRRAASALFAEVLEARTRLLGEDHPDTLAVAFDQARCRIGFGRRAEAEARLETICDRRLAVLGPDHPDTLHSLELRANAIARRGDRLAAYQLHSQVRKARLRVLGFWHPDMARSNRGVFQNWLGSKGPVIHALAYVATVAVTLAVFALFMGFCLVMLAVLIPVAIFRVTADGIAGAAAALKGRRRR